MKKGNHMLSLILLLLATGVFAQGELKNREAVGQIIEGNKPGKEVVIKIESESNPWENQRTFKYVSIKSHEKGNLKNKDWEKVKIKDADGYIVDGRTFIKHKYTPAGAIMKAQGVNKVTAVTTMASSLSKKDHFMERLLEGEVEVYRFYNYPPEVSGTTGNDQAQAYDQMISDLKNKYEILVKVGKKGKLVNFKKIKLKELLADCKDVNDRYLNEEYKLKPKAISNMIKMSGGGAGLEAKVLEIMKDYNACKSK